MPLIRNGNESRPLFPVVIFTVGRSKVVAAFGLNVHMAIFVSLFDHEQVDVNRKARREFNLASSMSRLDGSGRYFTPTSRKKDVNLRKIKNYGQRRHVYKHKDLIHSVTSLHISLSFYIKPTCVEIN